MKSNSSPTPSTGPFPRPRAATAQPTNTNDPLSPRQRAAVAVVIGLAHGLVFWFLLNGQAQPELMAEEITTLIFIDRLPNEVPVPIENTGPSPRSDAAPTAADATSLPMAPARAAPVRTGDAEVTRPPVHAEAAGARLELYDADGTVALTDDVVARLGAVDEGTLSFAFEQPGLLEDGAFMRRPVVIEYEATQFDQYWIPERDILTSLLERAVAATSDEVAVPLAGGAKLLCKVSLLAMGGGCQLANGRTPVSLDDPTTLSPEEDAQCAAWWNRIASPASQADWKRTHALYDFHCRKPVEKNLGPP